MVKVETGEILASPKVVYWMEMPLSIGEPEQIELLKRDIFVVNYDGKSDSFKDLKKNSSENTAFFYNFDKLIYKNQTSKLDVHAFAASLAQFIKSFPPGRSIIHTSLIDEKIESYFLSDGIPFIEKQFDDRRVALSTLLKLIGPLFSENNKIKRSFIRLILQPLHYQVDALNLSNGAPPVRAVLKDLSLNGASFIVENPLHLSLFKLKEVLRLKLMIRYNHITVNKSLITRIDEKNYEIGVSFDINNQQMVSEIDSETITRLVYRWLRQVIQESQAPINSGHSSARSV